MFHALRRLCCATEVEDEDVRISREIDQEIRKDRKEKKREYKLLLLGAGESGKSTFFRQLRIIHGEGYSDDDKKAFIQIIYRNILSSTKCLIEAMKLLNIPYEFDQSSHIELIKCTDIENIFNLNEFLVSAIKQLWNDPGIQTCFLRRSEFHLPDSTKYYLSDIDRISKFDFLPTQQDILRVRAPTTGATEFSFVTSNNIKWKISDVGGQKTERRKWIHYFEGYLTIIFFVAISEYDQMSYDNPNLNKLVESKNIFKKIFSMDQWFPSSSFILFFNKKDLLAEKILVSHMEDHFPEYNGPKMDEMSAREFIQDMFIEKQPRDKEKCVYWHFTCATDTDNIRFVFGVVKDTILQINLNRFNLS